MCEAPTLAHAKALEQLDSLGPSLTPEGSGLVVVHFSPPGVVASAPYRQWVASLPPSTDHIYLNAGNSCMGSGKVIETFISTINILVDFSLLLNPIEWNYTFHMKLA